MRSSLLVAALLASGCAGADIQATAEVTLWNRSQFEILEVRIHSGLDPVGAPNVLTGGPVPVDGRAELVVQTGERLTVVRRTVRNGPLVALTTETPLPLPEPPYLLSVFDQAFRLEAIPAPADGGS